MRIDKNHWLLTCPIAHRGLWGQNIVENSLSAYKLAAEKGFPIEIDVYSTRDGEIVSFHDASLKRITGIDGFIYDKTLSELKSLSLLNTDQKIPTLKEILDVCKGKSPLLIELKNQPDKTFVDKTIEILSNYDGEFAIQSFNPLYLIRVKKLAPNFLRGVLSSNNPDTKKKLEKFIVKRMPLNRFIKPDFISYDYKGLPLKNKKLPVIAWSITDKNTANAVKELSNNIIFEGFLPEQ